MEGPSQFSVGQIAHNLTCSIIEKPHTGFDDCLRILLSCFRKSMSCLDDPVVVQAQSLPPLKVAHELGDLGLEVVRHRQPVRRRRPDDVGKDLQ